MGVAPHYTLLTLLTLLTLFTLGGLERYWIGLMGWSGVGDG